jgi:hypothetical protein
VTVTKNQAAVHTGLSTIYQPTICNDEIGWYGVLLPVIVFPFCETLQIECPEGCVTIVVLGGIKENLVIRR